MWFLHQSRQHLERVVPSNIHQVVLINGHMFIPLYTPIRDAFERIIDGNHYRLCSDFSHRADKCWCGEMPARCNEDLIPEVVTYQLVFPHWHIREACAIEFVVYSVDIVGTDEDGGKQ
jgi:hypothetical protein